MSVVVRKSENLGGEVSAPPSKAYTHRMLVASLLSNGISRILDPLVSGDTEASLRAVEAFGAKMEFGEKYWTIKGLELLRAPKIPIHCGESGATLRFMIPVASLASGSTIFIFGSSLERRPIAPLLQSLKELGTKSSVQKREGGSIIRIEGGRLKGGKTSIRGDVSSQFISGLLFACPKAKMDTEINVTTPLESRSYVQMTMEVIGRHGIKVSPLKGLRQLKISSNQKYNPHNHEVPGDFSSAAFLLAAAAITSSKVKVKSLDCCTSQGDKAILNILREMGSIIKIGDEFVEIEGGQLNAVDVDAKDIPDLIPVCSVLACYSEGTTKIYSAKRLRYKESNRLFALNTELKKMGAEIAMHEDGLTIRGPCKMHEAIIDPQNDHRIAMACIVAALGAVGETEIQNSECISKSYPRFIEDLRLLGADVVGK